MLGGLTRRQALQAAGMAALAGLTVREKTRSEPTFAVHDAYVDKPDGELTTADSGQPWILSSSGQNPVVLRGAIGPPADHVPGAGSQGKAAGYAQVRVSRPCALVGGNLRWDASRTTDSSVCLGAFSTAGFNALTSSSSCHLSIKPEAVQFSVFSGGFADFTSLAPSDCSDTFPTLPVPMSCDGRSVYRCECVLDPVAGRAFVTIGDNPTLLFRDQRIRTVGALFPFWEYYTVPRNDNIGRFTSLWADTAGSDPQAEALKVAERRFGESRADGATCR